MSYMKLYLKRLSRMYDPINKRLRYLFSTTIEADKANKLFEMFLEYIVGGETNVALSHFNFTSKAKM